MKTRDICQVAILAALITAAKFALSFVANVELVTTLLVSYSLVLGMKKSLPICLIFIFIEVLIYGLSVWVIICLVRNKKHSIVYAVIIGIVLTALYGVQTTFIETIFFGKGKWSYFCARYISGLYFFIVHIVCNCIALPVLVPIITKTLKNLENNFNKKDLKSIAE